MIHFRIIVAPLLKYQSMNRKSINNWVRLALIEEERCFLVCYSPNPADYNHCQLNSESIWSYGYQFPPPSLALFYWKDFLFPRNCSLFCFLVGSLRQKHLLPDAFVANFENSFSGIWHYLLTKVEISFVFQVGKIFWGKELLKLVFFLIRCCLRSFLDF